MSYKPKNTEIGRQLKALGVGLPEQPEKKNGEKLKSKKKRSNKRKLNKPDRSKSLLPTKGSDDGIKGYTRFLRAFNVRISAYSKPKITEEQKQKMLKLLETQSSFTQKIFIKDLKEKQIIVEAEDFVSTPGESLKYEEILVLNPFSTVSAQLKEPEKSFPLRNLERSNLTFEESEDEAELFVGFDFGTEYSKVVVQESGTGDAWAIPFTTDKRNSYLIPSKVYLDGETYSLEGGPGNVISNIKLKLLESAQTSASLADATAFVALVLRYSNAWFSEVALSVFPGFSFDWSYRLGLPVAHLENSKMSRSYSLVLRAALILNKAHLDLTFSEVIQAIEQAKGNAYQNVNSNSSMMIFPEAQAQLEGFVSSDQWDPKRIKIMVVDVGGGTVDASIVNVTGNAANGYTYNCLVSEVEMTGIKMLHRERVNYLLNVLKSGSAVSDKIIELLEKNFEGRGMADFYPAKVQEYLSDVEWRGNPDVDTLFFKSIFEQIEKNVRGRARRLIDTESTQWANLQVILCGGGSYHAFYRQVLNFRGINPIGMDKPKSLIAPLLAENTDYHRLSVAFGLSMSDLGRYVSPAQIKPMKPASAEVNMSWKNNYVDQP